MIFKRKKPKGTEAIVHIRDLIVPEEFEISHPSGKKYKEYERRYIKNNGVLDKPITVIPEINEYGEPNKLVIVDGYIRYLIMYHWHEEYVPIKYQHEYIV